MEKSSGLSPRQKAGRQEGVALIIVLAFVVILTGVIIAYFSRVVANRQISDSSASQTKVSLFAQGATDNIIADLQEEIIVNSSASVVGSGTATSTLYTPLTPASMLPQASGSANGIPFPANLLKVSSATVPFFTKNAVNNATASIPSSGNPIAIVSSTVPSLNGRSVSLARWNASYLLPLASATDATPITTGSLASAATGAFVPPDWVLVARSGSNPTAMSQAVTWSSTNASTVVGRYAFAIYNEGGLLDANVAGYPSTTGTVTNYKPALASYKPVLSYADLTQLGLSQNQVDQLVAWRNYASAQAPQTYDNPTPFANVANVAASGSNYYNFVTSNPSGFLSVSSTTLNNGPGNLAESGTNAQGQSDRLFSSRQELIDFMEKGLSPGLSGTSLDILNYLATFTRGINQPSYVPYSGRPLITKPAANGGNNAFGLDNELNPAFPSVRVSGTGFVRNDGSIAVPGEPLVKKRFALSKIAWLTYLGPSADRNNPYKFGDPAPPVTDPNYDLWALINLYGVSPAYLAQGTDANIQKYFGLVWQEDQIPASRSGTTAASFHDNEYKWFYQGHNESGQSATGQSTGGVTVTNTSGIISRLEDLPLATGTSQREPDFFELLKASVVAGSKAMSSMNSTDVVNAENARFPAASSGTGSVHPYFYQYQRDTSLDYAIIQLGANIIDQAKVDGYSTRIVFNDGTPVSPDPHEFRGVENLPYLYRLNAATFKLRGEDCEGTSGTNQYLTPTEYKNDTQVETAQIQLKDTGVGMVMEMATIWNPHNSDSPLGDPAPAGPGIPTTVQAPRPNVLGTGDFRLVADSVPPDSLQNPGATTNYANYVTFNAFGYNNNAAEISTNANVTGITAKLYTTGPDGSGALISPGLSLNPALPQPLTSADNQLTFAVPDSTFFREPTVLARPNIPAGSDLQMVPPLNITQGTSILDHTGTPAWQPATQSFLSDSPNPLGLTTPQNQSASPGVTQGYIGICAALYPILFAYPTTGGTTITLSDHVSLNVNSGPGPFVTYRLQYKDPNQADTQGTGWVTYDEKYVEFNTQYVDTAFGTGTTGLQEGALSDEADKSPGSDWLSYTDPRTSRFAGINGKDLGAAGIEIMTPGGDAEGQEWPDNSGADDVLLTNRPDIHAGYGISDNRSTGIGYIPVTGETMGLAEFCYVSSTNWTVEQGIYRNGLLSQNSKQAVDDGIRFNGDSGLNNGPGSAQTYYADPDGQIRGAMGNYVAPGSGAPATTTIGLPEATSYGLNGVPAPSPAQPTQEQSRPYFLHRPFRSVGELAYVFSGTPWKNIDFFTPQSGDAALLDVFTAYETPETPNELVAGVVNLNTRQEPVLQALLAGAYVDEAVTSGTGSAADAGVVHPFTGAEAKSILTTTSTTNFLARNSPANTTVGLGPLQNVSELVGRWVETGRAAGIYSGPSADLTGIYASVYGGGPTNPTVLSMQNIDRFREAFLRPLAAVGNTRVWNLMIDVIAQTGRYPQWTTNPADFVVDGEQRYWVHVAIDRYTGQILDKQIEVVKE